MGRRRAFEEGEVLDRALLLFWSRGYEGTSTADLLGAMGLTNSSLYKAFGSKAALFERVADRYRERHLAFRGAALAEATPRAVARAVLLGTVDLLAGAATPPGCLDVNAGVATSSDCEEVRRSLVRNRAVLRDLLRDRLSAPEVAALLPEGLDADGAAGLVATFAHGLAIQAKDGASREALGTLVAGFLALWPDRVPTPAGPNA